MSKRRKTLGKVQQTTRGFDIIEFKDYDGQKCSLQESSLAIYCKPGTSAVWLGLSSETAGNARMHLHRDQVTALVKHLNAWLDKDTFQTKG